MGYAFTKHKRLLTKKEYEHVFKQSTKVVTPAFFVLTRLNDKNTARLGFALSKKYLPKASSRNRIKRIFREAFRIESVKLKNVDIVLLAKSSLDNLTNSEIRESLAILWQKIEKIYCII